MRNLAEKKRLSLHERRAANPVCVSSKKERGESARECGTISNEEKVGLVGPRQTSGTEKGKTESPGVPGRISISGSPERTRKERIVDVVSHWGGGGGGGGEFDCEKNFFTKKRENLISITYL